MKPPATTPGDIGDLFAGEYQNLSEADCAATLPPRKEREKHPVIVKKWLFLVASLWVISDNEI